MTEPAAPYPVAGFAVPKYNPRAHLPISKRMVVTIAPIHTGRHFIFASGKNLNMRANKKEKITKDTMKFTIWRIITNACEKEAESQDPNAESPAETTSDTIN